MSTAIERKQADLDDALGWVEDLRSLTPSRQDIFNATNYVVLLQDDLRKLRSTTMAKPVKTIDLTPTWAGIMPGIISILENGSEDGRKIAREELMKLARQVDTLNEKEHDNG